MASLSVKNVLLKAALVADEQFGPWRERWRAAMETGNPEERTRFFAQEYGFGEEVFLQRLAQTLGWPYLDLKRLNFSAKSEGIKELCQKITTKVAFQYTVMPTRLENNVLQVVVSNPFDADMLGAIHHAARSQVEFALAPRADIEDTLKRCYGVGAEVLDGMQQDDPDELLGPDNKEIAEGDQEASVIKFVNQVIWEAHKERATDIHFEPMEDQLRIRYRIDGMLRETPLPTYLKRFQSAIISRIKVMSGMNISEKRLPQDGRINVRIKKQEIDIRVSTVPTVYGESVSLRLLTRGKVKLELSTLGYSNDQEAIIDQLIRKPHGIFLVTGPTGSGKSTSLYAFLHKINQPSKRIITVEEPVEYELAGVNQIAVRPEIGLTFAMGLRHILRQDPNVVMVGEIRDLETAEIAIRAALTGHLVFSTLHTNDAASAFTRLIDMGIEPFLVASSVEAVMAQRLVRTICNECKTEHHWDRDYLKRQGFPKEEVDAAKIYKGAGCPACRELGYQGRIGIYELLVLSEPIRSLVLNRAPASNIAQKAIECGTRTLRMDGWRKVCAGITTIEEVLRVTQSEEHLAGLMEENLKTQAKAAEATHES